MQYLSLTWHLALRRAVAQVVASLFGTAEGTTSVSHFIALPCGQAVELEVSQRSLVLCTLAGSKPVLQATRFCIS
jgi:hypothetical protein